MDRRESEIARETSQLLDVIDELRDAAERIRASARVVAVLEQLRTADERDSSSYARLAHDALSRL
jgi:pilus assembly protein TadC